MWVQPAAVRAAIWDLYSAAPPASTHFNRKKLMMCTAESIFEAKGSAALVVQGGGMRGTYSAAALAAMEDAGLNGRFSDIYATSSGALNGAYFIAHQANEGVSIYVDELSKKSFIDMRRVRRIIDIDFLVDDVLTYRVPLDVGAVEASDILLHIGLTSASTGRLVWATNKSQWPLLESLRATAALPIFYGREVSLGNDSYVDGGVSVKLPLRAAVENNHENIVVILTRPLSYETTDVNRCIGIATRHAAKLQGHSPAVVRALASIDPSFAQSLELLNSPSASSGTPGRPRIWVVAPSAPIAGRLTRDRDLLKRTAALGREDAQRALGLTQ